MTISRSRLFERFSFEPGFVALVFDNTDANSTYSDDQAARILALHDLYKEWRSLSRADLLKLFKDLEWAFKNPSKFMTYQRVISKGLMLQLIPKQYLMRIELARAE